MDCFDFGHQQLARNRRRGRVDFDDSQFVGEQLQLDRHFAGGVEEGELAAFDEGFDELEELDDLGLPVRNSDMVGFQFVGGRLIPFEFKFNVFWRVVALDCPLLPSISWVNCFRN